MGEYLVYLITCLVNNKKYAGQTCQRISERWQKHKGDARNGADLRFSRAIRKHGEHNFEISIIQDGLTHEEADQVETLTIKTLGLLDPEKGYNMTEGGRGAGVPGEESRRKMSENSAGKRKDIPEEEVAELYRKGKSTRQIAEKFGASHATIRRIVIRSGVNTRSISESKLCRWRLEISITDVVQLYRAGKLIKQIAKELRTSSDTIRRRLDDAKEPLRSRFEARRIARKQRGEINGV